MADEKLYSQAELDAAKKTAADATLARATKGMVKQEDLDAAETRATQAEKKLLLNQKLPSIKSKYKELGGKEEVFEDYFEKHKEELLGAEEDNLEKTFKETIEKTKYAFDLDDGGDPTDEENKQETGSLLI